MRMMKNSIERLLNYGWTDRSISKYLMIKPNIIKYYRHKLGITRDEYQELY